MLFVFIYEENERNFLTECIRDFIFTNECDIQIALSTNDSAEMISAIQLHRAKGIYFLSEKFTAAAEAIKQYDSVGTIIYTKPAADEILFRQNIYDRLYKAYEEYISDENLFRFKTRGNRNAACAYEDILFFETDPVNSRWIIMHTKFKNYDLIGTLNNLAKTLPSNFFRCHKSFLVNIENIPDDFDKNIGIITMKEDSDCHVSVRKRRELFKKLNAAQFSTKPVPSVFRFNKKFILFPLCILLAFFAGYITDLSESPELPESPEIPSHDLQHINIPMSSASINIPANEVSRLSLEISQSSVVIETHPEEFVKIQNTGINLPPYTQSGNNLTVSAEDTAGVIVISIPENAVLSIFAAIENGDIQIKGSSSFAPNELEISVNFGSIFISNVFAAARLDLQTHYGNIYLENVFAPQNNFIYNANRGNIVTR
ncbi:MAG: LytTR family transcriptional regulator DNA-binding domain-containing protein [Clostridiales bacterium]|jgi:two-component system response regulator AgrA|nr:LytTR family transcriptional regulator DNA-binding domain-containing protein [Clostridiales bacterium]